MSSISMREYLRSGEFGAIRLGDPAESLRRAFGEASNVSVVRRQSLPGIWKYGDVEFHLAGDPQCVELIFCDTFERLHLSSTISLDHWFFEGHPSVELVEHELANAGIGYARQQMPHEESAFWLCLDSGVKLLFSNGGDEFAYPGVPGLVGFSHQSE